MLGIFLDTETNGLNFDKHRVIELAFRILDVQTGREVVSFESLIGMTEEEWKKSDPHSLQVNGFSWEEIRKGPPAAKVATEILSAFQKCKIERGHAVFICQNPSFDRAFFSQLIDADLQEELNWPYHWLDLASMYWTRSILEQKKPWETGVSKNEIAKVLALPPEEDPHKAMNGVDHLIACYEKVVGFPEGS
ncbi:MAG: 3'-5' exonuclease [Chlamydiia bacterium]|nr:3'-5' exonuclease [Chlamydiia bacterium]